MRSVLPSAVPVVLAAAFAAPAGAQTTFPVGAYSVSVAPSPIPFVARFAGDWNIRFGTDGQFEVVRSGGRGLTGHYQVVGDTLTVVDGEREVAAADTAAIGRYRWWPDSSGIRLALLGDHEEGRSTVLTGGLLKPGAGPAAGRAGAAGTSGAAGAARSRTPR